MKANLTSLHNFFIFLLGALLVFPTFGQQPVVNAYSEANVDSLIVNLSRPYTYSLPRQIESFNNRTAQLPASVQLKAHLSLAAFFENEGAFKLSAFHLAQSIDAINDLPAQENKINLRFNTTIRLGDQLKAANLLDSALASYRFAQQQAIIADNDSLLVEARLKIGDWYKKRGLLKEAYQEYDLALDKALQNSKLTRKITLTIGLTHLYHPDDPEKINFHRLAEQNPPVDSLSILYNYKYCQYLFVKNLAIKGQPLYKTLASIAEANPSWLTHQKHLDLGYYLAFNNFAKAKEFWQDQSKEPQSVLNSEIPDKLWSLRLQNASATTQDPPTENKSITENTSGGELTQPVIIIGSIVLLILIVAVFILNFKLRHKKSRVLVVTEGKSKLPNNMDEELATKMFITEINQLLLNKALTVLTKAVKQDNLLEFKGDVTPLIIQLEDILNRDMEPANMLTNIERLDNEFNGRLVAAYPNLNEREKQLCNLIRLNLSTIEIGHLLNVSFESAEFAIQELGVNMSLTANEDLYLVIANI